MDGPRRSRVDGPRRTENETVTGATLVVTGALLVVTSASLLHAVQENKDYDSCRGRPGQMHIFVMRHTRQFDLTRVLTISEFVRTLWSGRGRKPQSTAQTAEGRERLKRDVFGTLFPSV